MRDVEAAARAMGLQIQVLNASTSREIDAAFATFVQRAARRSLRRRRCLLQQPAGATCQPGGAPCDSRGYSVRDFAEAGGLMSYGSNIRMRIVRSASTPVAFSRAPSPPTCRSCSRPSSSWSSTPDREDARPHRAADAARARRRGDRVTRREFITLLGGAAAAWPLAARRAAERMRRIGVLLKACRDTIRITGSRRGFPAGAEELGWTIGRNLRDLRPRYWASMTRMRDYAKELVALAPDVILADEATGCACRKSPHVPIVFGAVTDPSGWASCDVWRSPAATPRAS